LLREEWMALLMESCKNSNPDTKFAPTPQLPDTSPWAFRYFEGCHVVFSDHLERDKHALETYTKLLESHGGTVMHQANTDASRIVSHFIVTDTLSQKDKEFIQEVNMHGSKTVRIVSMGWIDDSLRQELACAEETYEIAPERYMFSLTCQDDNQRHLSLSLTSNATALNPFHTQPSHLQQTQYLDQCRVVLLGYSKAQKRTLLPDLIDAGAVHIAHYIPGFYPSGFITHVIINTSNQKRFTTEDWSILESLQDVIQYQKENQASSHYEQYTHVVRDEWLTLCIVGRKQCDEADHLFSTSLKDFKKECDISNQRRRLTGASQVFEHIKFYIHKIESAEKYKDIESLITKNGGTFVSAKLADYAIVPAIQDLMGSFTVVQQEVTAYWVVCCVQERQLLAADRDLLFQPLRTDCQNNHITNPIICSCDIHGEKKTRLKRMVRYLEGRMEAILRPKKTNFLLCDSVYEKIKGMPPKYKRCITVRTPIVKSEWITESLKQGHLVDPFPFMHPASQDQIKKEGERLRLIKQRKMLQRLEEERTLQERQRLKKEAMERQIIESYQDTQHDNDKRRKVLALRGNDEALPDMEVLEYSPEEEELEDKREVPESFKKHVRKRKREGGASGNSHQHAANRQDLLDSATPRKRRKRIATNSTRHNGDRIQPTRDEENVAHDTRKEVCHHSSRSGHVPPDEDRFEDEMEDLLSGVVTGNPPTNVSQHSGQNNVMDESLPPLDNGDEQNMYNDEDHDESNDSDDLESDASSQGSMDVEAFQQIIDDFPEFKSTHAAPQSSSPVNTITRAELRANYPIERGPVSLPAPLAASTNEEDQLQLDNPSQHISHGTDTQKDQFHQSQHIGWKSGTQAATQYSSSMCRISISNEEDRDAIQNMVERLGGEYVDDVDSFTHLAVGSLKKTAKILCAIVSKTEIVHTSWIRDSDKNGEWLPTTNYHWDNPRFDSLFEPKDKSTVVSRSVRKAIRLHWTLDCPVFQGLRVNCLLAQMEKTDALLQILCRGGAIHAKDIESTDYLFVSPGDIKSMDSPTSLKLCSLLDRNPDVKVVDMNAISKKVMNPKQKFHEITEKSKILKRKPKSDAVELIDSGTDVSEAEDGVTVVRTKRIRRKRRAV